MIKLGVLISGNGSTLQTLLESQENYKVTVVISSHPKYGVLRARRAGVPVEVLPQELRGASKRQEAEGWISKVLAKYNVQKVFLAGFMRIVSSDFISKYNSMFNVHPSLLPKYKGLDSLSEALKAGDREAGVTVHRVAELVDSGEFVLQRQFDIPRHRDSQLTHLWLHIQEQRLLRDSIRKIIWPITAT